MTDELLDVDGHVEAIICNGHGQAGMQQDKKRTRK